MLGGEGGRREADAGKDAATGRSEAPPVTPTTVLVQPNASSCRVISAPVITGMAKSESTSLQHNQNKESEQPTEGVSESQKKSHSKNEARIGRQ